MNIAIDLNLEEIEAMEGLVSDEDAKGMRVAKAIRKMRGDVKSNLGWRGRVGADNIISPLGKDLTEARKREHRLMHELTKEMCRN